MCQALIIFKLILLSIFNVACLEHNRSLLQISKLSILCDQVFELDYNTSVKTVFHIKISHIQPYLQKRKLCFLLKFMGDCSSDQIQPDDEIFFLRVDSMPNECINVKNDLKFQKIPQNNEHQVFYMAEAIVSKDCAKISQNSIKTTQYPPIDLIVEVRQVFIELFGFPLYERPFKDLFYLVLVLIGVFFFVQFRSSRTHKLKSI